MRQFRSTTGRMWSVQLERVEHLRIGSQSTIAVSGKVLRFHSPDGMICDLEEYPPDWERFTETGLLSLLGRAMAEWADASPI